MRGNWNDEKGMKRMTAVASRPEDEPRTLVFVDMLGFAELTRRNPTRILDWGPDEHGFAGSGTTELQSRVVRFHSVLRSAIAAQAHFGGVSAQVFSDCAYIDATTSLSSLNIAVDLMQSFIDVDGKILVFQLRALAECAVNFKLAVMFQ